MTRLTLALLACTAAAVGLYVWRPGPIGLGSVMGICMGAGLGALGVLWVAREARRGGLHAFRAQTLLFLLKLGVLTAGALALRFLPQLEQSADWRAWLLAFAAASVLVLFVGLWGLFPIPRRPLLSNGDRLA